MDVTSTTTATSTGAKTSVSTQETATSTLSGDFDTFLKLLTTQLENQDPLQPMDSTEFIAQLASFSSVEQQIGTNTRLDELLSIMGGSADGFATWIGLEVQAPTSAAFAGTAIDVSVAPVANADRAVLVVKNDFGTEVSRQTVAAGETNLSWDGTDTLGNSVPNGRYTFELESYSGETLVNTQAGQVFGTVTEVRVNTDGETVLVLEGGGTVLPETVTALR